MFTPLSSDAVPGCFCICNAAGAAAAQSAAYDDGAAAQEAYVHYHHAQQLQQYYYQQAMLVSSMHMQDADKATFQGGIMDPRVIQARIPFSRPPLPEHAV